MQNHSSTLGPLHLNPMDILRIVFTSRISFKVSSNSCMDCIFNFCTREGYLTGQSASFSALMSCVHFTLFHVTFREFLSISAEPWGPLSLKILFDEITLQTYDRLRNNLKNYLLVSVAEFVSFMVQRL